jgi:serine/threonine-protein kinase
MATVYLGLDLKHHRPVALKVLHPQLAAVLGADRFLREIETVANLNHPHILPLFDSGGAEGLLWYAMPLVEGESLRDRLNREQQLPVNDALQITREVADALGYAHTRGIIHRDIKPENILLAHGHALVADFGIARAIGAAGGEKLTETGLAIGTPSYMSPEQALGEKMGGRTDIYALGCVLYEMLAGEPPYTGPSAQAILARRLSVPVPSLRTIRDNLPEPVERAILTALARAPADRFATAAQFSEALSRRDSAAAPVRRPHPLRPTPPGRATRAVRRRGGGRGRQGAPAAARPGRRLFLPSRSTSAPRSRCCRSESERRGPRAYFAGEARTRSWHSQVAPAVISQFGDGLRGQAPLRQIATEWGGERGGGERAGGGRAAAGERAVD